MASARSILSDPLSGPGVLDENCIEYPKPYPQIIRCYTQFGPPHELGGDRTGETGGALPAPNKRCRIQPIQKGHHPPPGGGWGVGFIGLVFGEGFGTAGTGCSGMSGCVGCGPFIPFLYQFSKALSYSSADPKKTSCESNGGAFATVVVAKFADVLLTVTV